MNTKENLSYQLNFAAIFCLILYITICITRLGQYMLYDTIQINAILLSTLWTVCFSNNKRQWLCGSILSVFTVSYILPNIVHLDTDYDMLWKCGTSLIFLPNSRFIIFMLCTILFYISSTYLNTVLFTIYCISIFYRHFVLSKHLNYITVCYITVAYFINIQNTEMIMSWPFAYFIAVKLTKKFFSNLS